MCDCKILVKKMYATREIIEEMQEKLELNKIKEDKEIISYHKQC